MTPETLSDVDIFFNYGSLDLELETMSDIYSLLLQPAKSLFYDRKSSAGIGAYENQPNTIIADITMQYEIAMAINRRNYDVGDGNSGTKDRRVAVSQSSINIDHEDNQVQLSVDYISFVDMNQIKNLSIVVGVKNA